MGPNLRIGVEAAIGIEPMHRGFADLCLTAWLRRRERRTTSLVWSLRMIPGGAERCQSEQAGREPGARKKPALGMVSGPAMRTGAGNGSRTRDFNLGKVALYH